MADIITEVKQNPELAEFLMHSYILALMELLDDWQGVVVATPENNSASTPLLIVYKNPDDCGIFVAECDKTYEVGTKLRLVDGEMH
jgi:hypothetical protein